MVRFEKEPYPQEHGPRGDDFKKLGEGIDDYWGSRVKSLRKHVPEPQCSELVSLFEDRRSRKIDAKEFEIELDRFSARVYIQEGDVVKLFPSHGDEVKYNVWRNDKRKNNGSLYTPEQDAACASGVEDYMKWYGPIKDRFDHIAMTIRKLGAANTLEDRMLTSKLLEVGHIMHSSLSLQVKRGRVVYLPTHTGDKYPTVLDAWANLERLHGGV